MLTPIPEKPDVEGKLLNDEAENQHGKGGVPSLSSHEDNARPLQRPGDDGTKVKKGLLDSRKRAMEETGESGPSKVQKTGACVKTLAQDRTNSSQDAGEERDTTDTPVQVDLAAIPDYANEGGVKKFIEVLVEANAKANTQLQQKAKEASRLSKRIADLEKQLDEEINGAAKNYDSCSRSIVSALRNDRTETNGESPFTTKIKEIQEKLSLLSRQSDRVLRVLRTQKKESDAI